MRNNGDVYKYIASYVDDLCIVAKDPKEITNSLINKQNYKRKGTESIKYHLGCNNFRDSDNTLWYAPLKYIEKMINYYFEILHANQKIILLL